MSVSLLSTKLRVPHLRQNAVSRSRLVNRVLAGVHQTGRFILLSGPAGFGKTTLLSDFVTAFQGAGAWLSLDSEDDDLRHFWTYLIHALRSILPEVGQSALALLQSSQPFTEEIIPNLLISDLSNVPNKLVLILVVLVEKNLL